MWAMNDQGGVDGGDGLVQQQWPLVGRWSNTMQSLPKEHESKGDICIDVDADAKGGEDLLDGSAAR